MTTIDTAYRRPGVDIRLWLIVCALIAGGLTMLPLIITPHAKTSHAAHVPSINDCFSGKGTLSPWYQEPGGRYGRYCIDNDGNLFWRISECEGPERVLVTQFKQGLRKLGRYLLNKEFVAVEAPPCH